MTSSATTRARTRPIGYSRVFGWVARHVALVTIAVFMIAPVIFVVFNSLMSDKQSLTATLVPTTWEWQNYLTVFTTTPLALWFGNSTMYAVLATTFMLISSVPAAYVLARIKFRGSSILFFIIIIAMLLPPQVKAVPLYVMWSQLGLTGSLWPLILPNLFGDAFSIFLLRQFFLTIPPEYADAARTDGCGEWGVLLKVIVPMARPGIAAAAIFSFFSAWSDYFGPLLYASGNTSAWTVSFGLATFHGTHSVNWPVTMAVTVLVTIPVVVIFFFAQRTFVEGITLTGVKG
jgi:multiple sugar transport system permease protein